MIDMTEPIPAGWILMSYEQAETYHFVVRELIPKSVATLGDNYCFGGRRYGYLFSKCGSSGRSKATLQIIVPIAPIHSTTGRYLHTYIHT